MIQNTDIVVLGGGSAGVAAAVAAASKGAKVVLLERNAFLGGKATAAEVGTICGLYKYSKSDIPQWVTKGFARTFAERLQHCSGLKPMHNAEGLFYLPYSIDCFKKLCHDLLAENKVKVYFNTVLDKVLLHEKNISAVSVIAAGNPMRLNLKSIVDSSGDSSISRALNIPVIKSLHYQAAAQVFTMRGVEEENESRLNMILMKALKSAIDENRLADFYDRVYLVQGSLKNKFVSFKAGIPLTVTYAPGNLQELRTVAGSFIENLADFLIKNVPVFKNARLDHIAPEVGTRTGQRGFGKYILTEDDVLTCRKFDNAVANAAWPIEEWEQHRRVKMRYFQQEDHYQVPAECLQSEHINNLFFSGRNISATDSAIASARVMGICLQTGFAAGCLAAEISYDGSIANGIHFIQNAQL